MPTVGLIDQRYRIFTDRSGMPYPTGITPKFFYFSFTNLIGYCAMFCVVIATQLLCLLCRLSGSRVQQQKSHSQPPVRDSHPGDSNLFLFYNKIFPFSGKLLPTIHEVLRAELFGHFKSAVPTLTKSVGLLVEE